MIKEKTKYQDQKIKNPVEKPGVLNKELVFFENVYAVVRQIPKGR
jgi:hypothetical protein